MEKMGWSKGKGLGANEDGMTDHIKASYKSDSRGTDIWSIFFFDNTINDAKNIVNNREELLSDAHTVLEQHSGHLNTLHLICQF